MDILKLFKKSKLSSAIPASNTIVPPSSVESPLAVTLAENRKWIEQQLANVSIFAMCLDILARICNTEHLLYIAIHL